MKKKIKRAVKAFFKPSTKYECVSLQDQLNTLHNEGVAIVILLCTGNFSEWESLDGVLFPSRTVAAMVSGLLPKGKIGVFSPLEEQCAQTKKRWKQRGYEVVSTSLSPNATANEATIAAKAMVNHAPDLLVFDCISYTRETKRIVSSKTSIPAILGISCAIRSAMELID